MAEGARRLLERIDGSGWIVQGDLPRHEGPSEMWQAALNLSGGHIHGLVNNAGIRSEITPDAPREEWHATRQRELQINVFAADGIVTVAIAPGWIRTEMAEQSVAQFGEAAALADIPVGNMATPAEVAELVAFASRHSQQSLNGATLDINGGGYIR